MNPPTTLHETYGRLSEEVALILVNDEPHRLYLIDRICQGAAVSLFNELHFDRRVSDQLAAVREDATRPDYHDLYHVYGLLAEEMAELLDEIRRRHQCGANVLAELVDIAMICRRAIEDLEVIP